MVHPLVLSRVWRDGVPRGLLMSGSVVWGTGCCTLVQPTTKIEITSKKIYVIKVTYEIKYVNTVKSKSLRLKREFWNSLPYYRKGKFHITNYGSDNFTRLTSRLFPLGVSKDFPVLRDIDVHTEPCQMTKSQDLFLTNHNS